MTVYGDVYSSHVFSFFLFVDFLLDFFVAASAISSDPLTVAQNMDDRDVDYYLSIGLNSNVRESDFKRQKLNLVIVLDISGSMEVGFDKYYYGGSTHSNATRDKYFDEEKG